MQVNINRLSSSQADFFSRLKSLISYPADDESAINEIVSKIIERIKNEGDVALLEYTKKFDHLDCQLAKDLMLPNYVCQRALDGLAPDLRNALEAAAARIKDFHQRQKQLGWKIESPDGMILGQKITPIRAVGLYVPGGKAVYPSSVLMNAIPAKVAGVEELIMVVPTPYGEQNQLVLAAAALTGVDKVFTIGGAQAVAALAFGTPTIPRVDKIVGPGNAYVASAKRQLFGKVGIDMIAGPSEILIIADSSTPAEWVAMDLFSQAEHDELAQSILITTDPLYADQVSLAINRLIDEMTRRDVIKVSLENRGIIITVNSLDEACDLSNQIAPEHLELSFSNANAWVDKITAAGAIFVGSYASESLGDYCAGPNHVLPTSGSARFSSPLGVYDFQKRSSLIYASKAGAQSLGKIAVKLAQAEGLSAHARSAQYRIDD